MTIARRMPNCSRATTSGRDVGLLVQLRHCTAKSLLTASPLWSEVASEDTVSGLQRIGVQMVTLEVGSESIVPSAHEVEVKKIVAFVHFEPSVYHGCHLRLRYSSSWSLLTWRKTKDGVYAYMTVVA